MPRTSANDSPPAGAAALLYHYCRLQLPALNLPPAAAERHLQRTYRLYVAKANGAATWEAYFQHVYALDWFLAAACLEGDAKAWEQLFAARTGRGDYLLVDALRARAARLYPRNEERQESAVTEFWGHLLVADQPESPPVLARYDGQRPLVPWLIRVFQNWHISRLRQQGHVQALPDDDLPLPLPDHEDGRWHEAFRDAAREALDELTDTELLILGLRVRYRMSQRDVAGLLGLHEGTISRQTTHLRDQCLAFISRRLVELGWTGDDLADLVRNEMASVLLDEPRLAADQLAALLAQRGKTLPKKKGAAALEGNDSSNRK